MSLQRSELGGPQFSETCSPGIHGKPTLRSVEGRRKFTAKGTRAHWELVKMHRCLSSEAVMPRPRKPAASALEVARARQILAPVYDRRNPRPARFDRRQTRSDSNSDFIGQIGTQMLLPTYFPLHGKPRVWRRSFLARMMVEIRVKRGWSYGAYSSFRSVSSPGPGMLG